MRRSYGALVSLALVIGLGIVLYSAFFAGPAVIDPPTPDLSGVDPEVRAAIEGAVAQVRTTPRSGEAWGRLGMVLTSHIFGNEALACFAQAERLEPNNPRWPYHQALIQLAHDPPAALPKLQTAVELCRDETDGPRLRLAELHLALGAYEAARTQFEILLQLRANHPRAQLGMARLHLQGGEWAQSRAALQHALNHPLTRKSALALSAEVFLRDGDVKSAQQERARMVGLPDDPDWADTYAAEAAQFKVGESARLRLAGQLLDRNRGGEAKAVLEKLVRDYPTSAQAWILLGWSQMNQGQLTAADQSLQTALELDPNAARAWLYRGAIHFQRKDRKEAIACFRKAVQCKTSYLEAHFNLGRCLKEEGDRDGAVSAFRDAIRCQPLSAPAHAGLGELLLMQGRTEEAVVHLQHAVDLNPDDSESRKLLQQAPRK